MRGAAGPGWLVVAVGTALLVMTGCTSTSTGTRSGRQKQLHPYALLVSFLPADGCVGDTHRTQRCRYIDQSGYLELRTQMSETFSLVNELQYPPDDPPPAVIDAYSRVLVYADKILTRYPDDPYTHNLRIRALFSLGRGQDELNSWRQAIANQPENALNYYALYRSMRANRYPGRSMPGTFKSGLEQQNLKALDVLHQAVSLRPCCFPYAVEVHRAAEQELIQDGKQDEVIEVGMMIRDLIPDPLPPARDPVHCYDMEWMFEFKLAGYLLEEQRYEEAVALYTQIGERYQPEHWNPEMPYHRYFASVYSNLGVCCVNLQQPERARQAYHRALEVDPEARHALYCLALLDKAQRKYQQALAHLYAVAKSHPEYRPRELELLKIEILYQIGELDGAWVSVEELLQEYPNDAEALRWRNTLREALSDTSDAELN